MGPFQLSLGTFFSVGLECSSNQLWSFQYLLWLQTKLNVKISYRIYLTREIFIVYSCPSNVWTLQFKHKSNKPFFLLSKLFIFRDSQTFCRCGVEVCWWDAVVCVGVCDHPSWDLSLFSQRQSDPTPVPKNTSMCWYSISALILHIWNLKKIKSSLFYKPTF